MKTKDKNEFTYSKEVIEENNVSNDIDERKLVWTKVIIAFISFTIFLNFDNIIYNMSNFSFI